jgi:hypothetical protein
MKTLGTLEKKGKLSLPSLPPRAMTAVGENNDELVAAGAASSAHYDTTRASLGLLFFWESKGSELFFEQSRPSQIWENSMAPCGPHWVGPQS